MGILSRGARAARPQVRVANPVLARYLEDLAQQARMADAAADARKLDIHFGRVAPDDPFAGIGGDGIADMVGATAAPRRWLEAADYNKAIDSMMPNVPGEPFADALARFDRSRGLVQGRLDRLTPEQRPGSLGLVGRQYQADQAAARAADILADRNRTTAMQVAGAGAIGAGAFGARMAMEGQQNEQDAALLDAWESERARLEEEAAAQLAEENRVAAALREEQARARRDRAAQAGMDRFASELDLYEDAPVVFDPMINEPSEDEIRQRTLAQFTSQPFLTPPGEEQHPYLRGKNTFFAADFRPPSPEESVAAAPGPESPVSQVAELEDLPGPQLRSIRALMRGGIPEGRARDIILKGSSMSPDEYRMVTGGRR